MRLIFIVLLTCIFVVGAWLASMAPQSLRAAPSGKIVFYDPDANHQAILQITSWFNHYLEASKLGLRFQPVQSKAVLASLLNEDSTVAVIAPASLLEEERRLQAILVPTAKGSPYYRKQLMVLKAPENNDFSGKTIAAAVLVEGQRSAGDGIIELLVRGNIKAQNAMIIPVPKDIDALLALSFGHVAGALATTTSVKVLRLVNPNAAGQLQSIFETGPILRPPVSVVRTRTSKSLVDDLRAALMSMSQHPQGRRAMEALGFDGWTPFEPRLLGRKAQ